MNSTTVTIVGGGLTGAALAIQLMQAHRKGLQPGLKKIRIIEPAPNLGLGTAYSTSCAEHLLNVPAKGMSLFADAADDFTAWLEAYCASNQLTSAGMPEDQPLAEQFVPRQLYGRYVLERYAAAVAEKHDALSLEVIQDKAASVSGCDQDWTVHTASGAHYGSEQLVLCLGNFSPTPLKVVGDGSQDNILQSPWNWTALQAISNTARVCIVGSGLTMVDVILTLQAQQHQGEIKVISRHGALPKSHAKPLFPVVPSLLQAGDSPLQTLKNMRKHLSGAATDHDWRQVVDSIRPISQDIWLGWTDRQRRQFLRHLASPWGVHRHRIAKPVAEQLQHLLQTDKLSVAAGSLQEIAAKMDNTYEVVWRPRAGDEKQSLVADVVINCTGPSANLKRIDHQLLHQLVEGQYACWDGLGLSVNKAFQVITDEGNAHRSLFALGPLTKGSFFEIIAVPDIRQQVAALSSRGLTTG